MSERWGAGLGSAEADVVFDLERAAPEVFAAVQSVAPHLPPTLARVATGIPVMSSAVPGLQGVLYRLRWHNRSVCLALGPHLLTSDVIVIKGSEPFLPDFAAYLDWMQSRQFGTWPRPIMEHFPLFEGKAPGTLFLDEALKEAGVAMEVQRAHLRHYGELMRVPVPLLVFRLREADQVRVTEQLRSRMSEPAFERVEPRLARGIGVFAYYYPGPPVRVHAAGRPSSMLPGQDARIDPRAVTEVMVPGWTRMAARLLWLGYFPSTPLSWRLGDIFEPNNACLDGGACDVGSIYPMSKSTNDGFFARSVVLGVGSLRTVLARVLGLPLGEVAATLDQDVLAFYLGEYVKRAMEQALDAEARETLSLDPRVREVFGSRKPLTEVLTLFRTFNSYIGTDDYVAGD
jgi:hypothetical protein